MYGERLETREKDGKPADINILLRSLLIVKKPTQGAPLKPEARRRPAKLLGRGT